MSILRSLWLFLTLSGVLCAAYPAYAEVKVEKVTYFNQPNCYKLSNGTVEVIVTTDIGPRILRYGFVGEENVFAELPDTKVTTEFGEWNAYGGHRLWHAPEGKPRSYSPDNSPIESKIEGGSIRLTQPVEPKTGILKEILVTLDPEGTRVTVLHRLTNKNVWDVTLAPWAISIMAAGGVTILPQEPYRSHDDFVLPARPLVLWHYTDLADPRWTLGKKYLQLKTVETMPEPQKVGILNKQGWAAYWRNKTLFVKKFPCVAGATYPDYGSSCETYTAGNFMEIETLAPLKKLEPGETAEHTETWTLHKNVDIGTTEATLDAALTLLIGR